MPDSEFFRVAVEGPTIDGRVIPGDWLDEIVKNYDPATYSAQVNIEHIPGVSPDGPFINYGSVDAVKVMPVELNIGGRKVKRKALYARFKPNDAAVKLNRTGQKPFSSIEVTPDFSQTGTAYLSGIAMTDKPASLGTERLKFSAKPTENTNLFSASVELEPEPAADAATAADPTGVLASMKAMFDKFVGQPAGEPAGEEKPKEEPAAAPAAAAPDAAAFGAAMSQMATSIDAFAKATAGQIAALETKIAALEQKQEEAPAGTYRQRPAATGGDGVSYDKVF